MEFNLNLSTGVSDIVGYFQGNNNKISSELDTGVFDNILDKSFCDSDESEDIDYNLILNLLNNLKLFNNQENFTDMENVYTGSDQVDSLISVYSNISENDLNIKINDYKVEQNSHKIQLSDREIEVLKKFDDIISKNKIEKTDELFKVNKSDNYKFDENENTFKSNLVGSEKFSQLENSNTVEKLKLIRSNDLDKLDKDLDALESIVNRNSDNNFMLSNNQLANKDLNSMNTTPTLENTTIRQEYMAEDIIKTVKYLKSSGQETITINISPKELGDMTIKIINNQDESSVVITMNNSEVFDLLNDNQSEIVKHLKDINISIKEISIEIKDNAQNNFSSNLSQEFEKNNKGNKQRNKKNIRSIDEEVDNIEEIHVEESINILI